VEVISNTPLEKIVGLHAGEALRRLDVLLGTAPDAWRIALFRIWRFDGGINRLVAARILLVDNEPFQRDQWSTVLQLEGYDVTGVSTVDDALQAIQGD
jgi:hypothetical protein